MAAERAIEQARDEAVEPGCELLGKAEEALGAAVPKHGEQRLRDLLRAVRLRTDRAVEGIDRLVVERGARRPGCEILDGEVGVCDLAPQRLTETAQPELRRAVGAEARQAEAAQRRA